jgi:hypothetical protein
MAIRVIAGGSFAGAMYSAAGTVAATRKVLSVELNNAFVFNGFGDHHTGRFFRATEVLCEE